MHDETSANGDVQENGTANFEETSPTLDTSEERRLETQSTTQAEHTRPSTPGKSSVLETPKDVTNAENKSVANSKDEEKHAPEEEVEDESKYLSGYKLAILSLGLCLTTFVIALDNTIIATAIPKITTVFNST
jgi:hypothetical protein